MRLVLSSKTPKALAGVENDAQGEHHAKHHQTAAGGIDGEGQDENHNAANQQPLPGQGRQGEEAVDQITQLAEDTAEEVCQPDSGPDKQMPECLDPPPQSGERI